MTVNVAGFRIRLPEFEDDTEYPEARIQMFLDDTVMDIRAEADWCGRYERAVYYYAAHLLTVGSNSEAGAGGSNVGPTTSKSAGGVSVTKGYVAKDRSDGDDWLISTTYGQQFINIRNMCFIGVLTV
tara:strand:- start:301 stop:681 length:381 start_codon:yes stop_codon:yes gene_type:complete